MVKKLIGAQPKARIEAELELALALTRQRRAALVSRGRTGHALGMPETQQSTGRLQGGRRWPPCCSCSGLLFRQLATLLLAVLMTIIIAIPLSAGATRLERHGVPRPLGALADAAGRPRGAGGSPRADHPDVHRPDERVRRRRARRSSTTSSRRSATSPATGRARSATASRTSCSATPTSPERLIGPITSIGLSVAGVFGALIVILITAYYMAVRPQPLVDGALRLVPPSRRRPRTSRDGAAARGLDRLDAGRRVRHVHLGHAALHRADDHRARLRDPVRRHDRAARGRALLRRDRRRDPAGAVRVHRLARARRSRC